MQLKRVDLPERAIACEKMHDNVRPRAVGNDLLLQLLVDVRMMEHALHLHPHAQITRTGNDSRHHHTGHCPHVAVSAVELALDEILQFEGALAAIETNSSSLHT